MLTPAELAESLVDLAEIQLCVNQYVASLSESERAGLVEACNSPEEIEELNSAAWMIRLQWPYGFSLILIDMFRNALGLKGPTVH